MMYKSQFWKIDTYNWFCGPRSHIRMISGHVTLKTTVIAAENSALPSQEYIVF